MTKLTKAEKVKKLQKFIQDLERLGVRVVHQETAKENFASEL